MMSLALTRSLRHAVYRLLLFTALITAVIRPKASTATIAQMPNPIKKIVIAASTLTARLLGGGGGP